MATTRREYNCLQKHKIDHHHSPKNLAVFTIGVSHPLPKRSGGHHMISSTNFKCHILSSSSLLVTSLPSSMYCCHININSMNRCTLSDTDTYSLVTKVHRLFCFLVLTRMHTVALHATMQPSSYEDTYCSCD